MSVIDAAAVGEVLETFPVCASPIQCIAAVPAFDENDPDVIAGECVSMYTCWSRCTVYMCVCVFVTCTEWLL